jgi:hypothetical protein
MLIAAIAFAADKRRNLRRKDPEASPCSSRQLFSLSSH